MRMAAPRLPAGMVVTVLALAACSGGGSSEVTPTPVDRSPPTVPASITVAALSPTEIRISWSASVDAGGAGLAGYHVYRNGAATPVATVSVTATGYTDSNLSANTSYSYTVNSFDGASPPNESALSASISATTPPMQVIDTTPPTVPTNLAVNPLSPTQVRLTWTASTDAGSGVAGYRVFRNGGATAIATVSAGTTYTDSGLTANTAYIYAISAFDAATPGNESALTTTVNVTTPAVPDVTGPTTPTGLTATALSSTQILVSWTASTDTESGVGGYRIYRDGSASPLAEVTTTSYTDSGLTAGTLYSYRVRAFDQATPTANVSALTIAVFETTLAAPDAIAPTVPANVTATALSTTQIQISWSASSDSGTGVGGYSIYRDGSASPLATVTSTSYTDSGLTASTAYSYRVRAFDLATPTANVSALSTAATATTQAAPDTTAPTVPAGVAAVAESSSQIEISWSASTDAESGVGGYRIYRNGSASPLATVTSTNYTDTGLTAGITYSYRVRAFDLATPTANVSALSAAASATTPALPDVTAPTVPAGVTATAQSSTQILISWSPSTDVGTGVAGYRIYRDGSATVLATVTTTSYADSGLTASTAYSYRVRAFDLALPAANESALSTAVSATTLAAPDTTAPTVPANVTAAAQSSTQILISWSASTDTETGVGGYRIYRDGSTSPLATVTSTSYTDIGLTPSTAYSYRVRAFDQAAPTANLSALSAAASATTPEAPDITAPTVPGNVAATALSTSQIQISWSASTDTESGVGGYRIYRDGSASPLATVTTTSYTDAGLTASTTYNYRVLAFDLATPPNASALSAAVSATTQTPPDTTAPTVPANVTATALSSSQIQISWSASTDTESGVAGYRIYRDGSATVLATTTATNYTDTGLTPSTAYSYRVRAFDLATPTANESALSVAATANTQAPPDTTAPTVPAGVTATAQSPSQIQISWSASADTESGVGGYRIYRNGSGIALATTTSTNYTDTGLTPSTAYSYRVRAFDLATPTANESALSVAAAATTEAAPDTTAPSVPVNVTATAQSTTQIQISWSASTDTESGVGGYRIYRDGSATALATVTMTSYTDSGLTASTAYSYRVRAFDLATPTANESALSAAASATTQTPPDTTAPSVPGNVNATALSHSQVEVSWAASTDADSGVGGYRIYRDGSSSPLATVSTTSYTDSGLAPSTLYSYRIRAFDLATPTANVSALSAAATATTQAAPPPISGLDARPSNPTCVAGAAPSQSAAYTYQQVYNAISLDAPVAMIQAPGDNSRWFVLQQGGIVKKFNNVASPPAATNFVNLTSKVTYSGERGLLGMAFHPDFPADPRVYVYYTTNTVDRLSEFRTTDGGLTLDPNSENILFNVTIRTRTTTAATSPSVPTAISTSASATAAAATTSTAPIGNGQRLTILLGKMLRIDVGPFNATPQPYTIPAGNPFSGNARCNVHRHGLGELPGNLRLRFPQSLALEFRSRHRRAVGGRRGRRRLRRRSTA